MAIVKVDRGETENCLYKVDYAVQPVFQSRITTKKKGLHFEASKPDLCLTIRKNMLLTQFRKFNVIMSVIHANSI